MSGIDRNVSQASAVTPVNEAPASGMKPIKLVSGYSSVSSAVGSGVVPASGTSEVPPPSNTKATGGWNKMRVDTFVTPAQATSPADPFSDPFNDRHATRPATLMLQPPGGAAPPAGSLPNPSAPGLNPSNPNFNPATPNNPAPPPPSFQPPNFPRPSLPGANTPDAPPTLPRDFDPTRPPPAFNPMPENPPPSNLPNTPPNIPQENIPSRPMDDLNPRQPLHTPDGSDMRPRTDPRPNPNNNSPSNRDCDRIYNDLNCCDSAEGCRKFIQGLLRDRLSKISLDIAPRFDSDDTKNEEQRANQEKMSQSRKWHRRGVTIEQRDSTTPIAEGTLHDLSNGRAIIVEASGQKRDIPLNDLSEDDLCFISGWWQLPAECAIADPRRIDMYARGWTPSTMNWTASAVCHKPLYFEQVQHERYGHSAGPIRQPFIDGVHFFGSCFLLPYSMALDPPWECEYALGYYRPGSCAPWHIPPFPFSPRAAMAQAGVVVGGIYIMP